MKDEYVEDACNVPLPRITLCERWRSSSSVIHPIRRKGGIHRSDLCDRAVGEIGAASAAGGYGRYALRE